METGLHVGLEGVLNNYNEFKNALAEFGSKEDEDTWSYVGEVSQNLKCSICLDVMTDPYVCREGDHAFCGAHIKEWLRTKNTCPIDRRSLSQNHLRPILPLKNLLDELRVRCNHCKVESARHQKKHDNSCQLASILCRCGLRVRLRDSEEHKKQCPKEKVACDICSNVLIERGKMDKHDEEFAKQHVEMLKPLKKKVKELELKLEEKYRSKRPRLEDCDVEILT